MYTLQAGDYVRFLLATDRRNQSQRAVSVALDIEKTKELNHEEREFGVVAAVKVFIGGVYKDTMGGVYKISN